jgi:hypothetical protein
VAAPAADAPALGTLPPLPQGVDLTAFLSTLKY